MWTLFEVFKRLESAGLTLKRSKCEFGLSSVTYLGHVIDHKELHSSPDKVRAIKNAPEPTNTTELKAFLGLINYYHIILSPLYRLLKKEQPWKWIEEHSSAFVLANKQLHSLSVLAHFDPTKKLIVSTDASPYSIGAVLSHKMEDGSEKPITFASRTLSISERKYPQIEKEALAIIFAVKKFNQYLQGSHFTIHSDHKPLQYLFKEEKPVPPMASARIQRWVSRLRLPDTPSSTPIPSELTHLIHQLSSSIITTDTVRQWTEHDPVLARVQRLILNGWTVTEPESSLLPYYNRRTELSTMNGCVLWGSG